jgi:hypothetical protein
MNCNIGSETFNSNSTKEKSCNLLGFVRPDEKEKGG